MSRSMDFDQNDVYCYHRDADTCWLSMPFTTALLADEVLSMRPHGCVVCIVHGFVTLWTGCLRNLH